MIEQNNIIHPYAFEIKKQCILNIAYMVLKITKDDMEDNTYIKNEYLFVENEETKDIAEKIIDTLVKDVINEKSKDNIENNIINKNTSSSFWSSMKIF